MQLLSNLVRITIPNYLAHLPIPDSIGGWFHLSVREWASLIPPTVVVGGISYYSYITIMKAKEAGRVNPCIKKEIPKVVDFIDIEDISDKASLCRCWRSKNWPYCDGSHGDHNKATGDNVGPVVVRHSKKGQ